MNNENYREASLLLSGWSSLRVNFTDSGNYIKVNGKKYTAGLKNNSGYVYMKLPKGKKVRFGCGLKKGYKIKEAYTDAFSSVGRVDITKQKIVLRKGMVLHIVYMKRFNPQIWGELTIIVK